MDELERKNLEDILAEEHAKLQEMSARQKIVRKLKNKIVRSHDFRDNDFSFSKSIKKIPKIVVYSCITGGYDNIAEPVCKVNNIDYVLFSDDHIKSKVWEVRSIPEKCKRIDPLLVNRYIKMHPHEAFKDDYEYSIYIDGNIKVIGDLTPMTYVVGKTGLAMHRHSMRDDIRKEVYACIAQKKGNKQKLIQQIKRYKKAGFPRNFGMLECNVIVADLKNIKAESVLDAWWEEFINSGSMRDQISLPYVLWKMKYTVDDVGNLGYNVYRNPKLRKVEHKL